MTNADRIATDRLVLHPMDESLAGREWAGWLNDPENVAFSRQRDRVHTPESCAEYVRSFRGTPNSLWAITLTGSNRHVGNIAAHVDERNSVANVALMIGAHDCKGMGLATEALVATAEWLMNVRGIRKVEVGTMAANKAMIRVARKSGMIEDGRRRGQFLLEGKPVDVVYFALFAKPNAGDAVFSGKTDSPEKMKTDSPKSVALIEARMGSSRLPGKVMLDMAGAPMLQRMIERVRLSRSLDEIVVATTTNPSDDIIQALCDRLGCPAFRGSEHDMLDRLLQAARAHHADIIVQLTGDCPLIDPAHIDRSLDELEKTGADYVSNSLTPSFPIGFDVRLFPTSVLEEVDRLTMDPIDRVHGSYYIYTHPEQFRLAGWEADRDMEKELRLTVDEFSDYEVVRRVFEALLPGGIDFTAEQVVNWLREHPEIAGLNRNVRQKRPEEG
ncbi:GNAT family N-acetyltransferase [Pseudodesulfovibrio tunisiensis]|uniref:GNAT family N-acetyltransferase n=1 Tax=Pseudodesulfovibrio tunisiensis TaxID=463192 RepID=UPI001FB493F3|nr:GNAT family N-acetyltransferase [Pseudodesulfovibrio tunisiensis]